MEGAEGSAEYNMRYVYTVGGGDLPGIDVTVPLPITGKIIAWRVKIAWDLKTVDRRIQVTSRSKVKTLMNYPCQHTAFKTFNREFEWSELILLGQNTSSDLSTVPT